MTDQFEPPLDKIQPIEANEFYRFVCALYLQRDTLSWSRAQLIFAVEAGVLAGAFSNKDSAIYFVPALIAGSVVIFLIWRLVQRDWQVRDQYNLYFDKFHKEFLNEQINSGRIMTVAPKSRWYRGAFILKFIIWSLITFNLFCVVAFLSNHLCKG